jgi:hypothetical protein
MLYHDREPDTRTALFVVLQMASLYKDSPVPSNDSNFFSITAHLAHTRIWILHSRSQHTLFSRPVFGSLHSLIPPHQILLHSLSQHGQSPIPPLRRGCSGNSLCVCAPSSLGPQRQSFYSGRLHRSRQLYCFAEIRCHQSAIRRAPSMGHWPSQPSSHTALRRQPYGYQVQVPFRQFHSVLGGL